MKNDLKTKLVNRKIKKPNTFLMFIVMRLLGILNKAYNEIKIFLDERRAYIPDDETKELLNTLHQADIECIALKNYYNNNTTITNSLMRKFPNNIIAKFKKIRNRELYNDPVEEEFEILKKK